MWVRRHAKWPRAWFRSRSWCFAQLSSSTAAMAAILEPPFASRIGYSSHYVLRDSELVGIVRDVIPAGFPPRRRFSVLNADLAEIATVSQSEDPNRYEIAVGGRRSATIPHSRPVTPRRSSGSRRSLSLLGRANALIDRWLARVWVIEGVSGDQLATVTYLAGAYVLELDPRADNAHRAAAVAFCLMIRGGDGGGSGVIDLGW